MTNPLLNVTQYRKQWVEGYNRQSQQLDRYHKQLTLRDQQEERAKTAVTPVKVLESLSSLVNATGKLADQHDANKADKVTQKLDAFGVTGDAFDVLEMLQKHDGNEEAIHKEYTNYAGLISGLPPGAKDYLKSLHGRNLYWAKAYLAKEKALELPTRYSNLLKYDGDDESIKADQAQLTLDLNAAGGDELKKRAVLKHWASKQFGDEFLSDEILSKYAIEHINNFLNIDGIQSLHESVKAHSIKDEQQFVNEFNIAKTTQPDLQQFVVQKLDIIEADVKNAERKFTSGGAYVNGVYLEGITEKSSNRTIARKILANRLIKLSNGDEFLRSDLNNLTERGSVKTPQGDSIENFFTEAELEPIYAAADRATIRAGLRATAAKEKQNENLVNKALAEYSGDNWNKDKLQAAYNELERNGATDKQLERIEKAMNNNNTQASYIEESTTYKPYESGGYLDLDDDVIEAIPNEQFRTEVQTKKNDYLTTHEAAKIPQRTEGQISRWLGGEDVTTFEKLTLHGEAVNVKIHLQKKAHELSVIGQDKFGYKGDELANFVTTELQKYWTANGGDLTTASFKNYKGPTLESKKFMKNVNGGTYDNFESWRVDDYKKRHKLKVALQKASTRLTQEQTTNISNGIKKQFFALGGYDVPDARMKIIDQKGSVIETAADLQIMLLNQEYSQEFLVQCKTLKMPPAVVFEHQVAAIIEAAENGDEDAIRTVNTLNLNQVEIPDNEADFWKGINDNLDHPHIAEISNLLTTKGWENLTAKQKARVGFSFLNNDFSNTEIYENGVPLRIGGYDKRAHKIRTEQLTPDESGANAFDKGASERSGQEWGPGGQPSASEVLKQQEKNKKKAEKEKKQQEITEANMNIPGIL